MSKSAKSNVSAEDLVAILESPTSKFTNSWDKTGKLFGQTEAGHFSCRFQDNEVSVLLTGNDDDSDGYVENAVLEDDSVIAAIGALIAQETVREPQKAATMMAPKGQQGADEA